MDLGAVDCGRLAAGVQVTQRIFAFQRRLDAFVEAVAQFDRRVDVALPGKGSLAWPRTTDVGKEPSST